MKSPTPAALEKLTPEQVLTLRDRAAAGEAQAKVDYLLWSTWKRLAETKGHSLKAKAELFRAVAEAVQSVG
jgi:hypothetical protein